MSGIGGAGFKYKPIPCAWNSRDVMLFAVSIRARADDLHLLFEGHPNIQVFPTYPVVLSAKGDVQDIVPWSKKGAFGVAEPITGAPALDIQRMIDGGRGIQFIKPLPTNSDGHKFELQSSVTGVYDKGTSGTVVASSTEFVDTKTGTVYTRMTSNHFYVGQGGWDGPKGPPTVNHLPPEREPDATHEIPTSAETAALYRLNGDSNPLHLVPEPGKKTGFGGPIIHGLFSWCATAYAIQKQWAKGNPANMRQFEARFSSPVKPGDTIRVKSWAMCNIDANGHQEIRFIAEVIGGKVCLSNGRAFIIAGDHKLQISDFENIWNYPSAYGIATPSGRNSSQLPRPYATRLYHSPSHERLRE